MRDRFIAGKEMKVVIFSIGNIEHLLVDNKYAPYGKTNVDWSINIHDKVNKKRLFDFY